MDGWRCFPPCQADRWWGHSTHLRGGFLTMFEDRSGPWRACGRWGSSKEFLLHPFLAFLLRRLGDRLVVTCATAGPGQKAGIAAPRGGSCL